MSGHGYDVIGSADVAPSRTRLNDVVDGDHWGQLGWSGRLCCPGGGAVCCTVPAPMSRFGGTWAGAARSRWCEAVVVLVAALTVGMGACSNSRESRPAEPLTVATEGAATTTSITTSAAPSGVQSGAEADAVLAAYSGMWEAMASAGRTSDWRSPELATYARDAALQKIIQSLYGDSQNGVVTQGEPRLSPQVTDLVPDGAATRARVLDCGDDSGWVKYRVDGARVDDVAGGRRRITAIVELGADGWKVVDFAIQGVGSC